MCNFKTLAPDSGFLKNPSILLWTAKIAGSCIYRTQIDALTTNASEIAVNISKRFFTQPFTSRIVCWTTLLFIACGTNAAIHAQTSFWSNPDGGIYESPSNWSGGVPDSSNDAMISLLGEYTIEFLDDQTVNQLTITNGGDPTFKVVGAETADKLYTVNGDALINSRLTLDGFVDGGNLNIAIGGELNIEGQLNVFKGAQVTGNTIDVDDGEIMISSGAVLSTPGGSTLENNLPNFSFITLTGTDPNANPSHWESGALHLLSGAIRVEDGALLTSGDVFHIGTTRIRGPGSKWLIDGVSIWGGDTDTNDDFTDVFIDDGAHVSNGTTFIANAFGNQTSVALDTVTNNQNANSSWTSSGDVFLGGNQNISRGVGRIVISKHSRLEIAGTLKIWDDSRVSMIGNSTLIADTIDNTAEGGFLFFEGAALQVNQFVGDLETNRGVLDPAGDATGSTSILGTLTHGEDGTLAIDIGGTLQGDTYDVVASGLAILEGALNVTLINGFVPEPTDEFTVLLASNIVGELANAPSGQRLQTTGGGGSFVVNYGLGSPFDASMIVLSDFEAGGFMLGDVNGDGSVDLLDVAPFVDAITAGTFIPAADINGDGAVDLLDVAPFVALLTN